MADLELSDIEISSPLVLIVDDVTENVEMLYRILQNEKYRFAVATDATETYKAVEKELPDLILLDVMLPDEDGFRVAETLNRLYGEKVPRIIFITARAHIEDKIKGFSVGGKDYVSKPFNNREVQMRVRTHIDLLQAHKRQEGLIEKLRSALEEVETLRGVVPICASCKKIRDDAGYWRQVEEYMSTYAKVEFSHSLCPDCLQELYPEYAYEIEQSEKDKRGGGDH